MDVWQLLITGTLVWAVAFSLAIWRPQFEPRFLAGYGFACYWIAGMEVLPALMVWLGLALGLGGIAAGAWRWLR